MAAELAATTHVPYDPMGRRRFMELDAELRSQRRMP